jgi:hypothetical protein
MLDKNIADFGGVKVDARPVKNPTSQQTANNHNNIAESVAQGTRTIKRVIVSFNTSAGAPGAITVIDNRTVWGNGASYYPAIAKTGTGVYTITYNTSYTNALGTSEAVSLVFPHGQMAGSTFGHVQVEVTSAAVLTVRVFDAAGAATDAGGSKLVTVWSR